MTAEQNIEPIEESKKLIRRVLASINVQNPELDIMVAAYEKSIRARLLEWQTTR